MDNTNLTNVQQAVIVSEISIAKNYAIKSNNLSNETNANLNLLKNEVYNLENKLNTITNKLTKLCNILESANLPNVNSSITYENL